MALMKAVRFLLFSLISLCLSYPGLAQTGEGAISSDNEIQMEPIFSDNMVVQRNQDVNIWGQSSPDTKVLVEFAGKRIECSSNKEGNWKLKIPPMPHGGPHEMRISGGKSLKVIRNVMIGDIWFCAGQSNMALNIARTDEANNKEIFSDNKAIRVYYVKRQVADKPSGVENRQAVPSTDPVVPNRDQWTEAVSGNIRNYPAVPFFFAYYYNKTGIPTGLITCTWGGSPISSWLPEDILMQLDETKIMMQDYHERFKNTSIGEIHEKEKQWLADRANYVRATKKGEKAEYPAMPAQFLRAVPAGIFNGMVSPLIPYNIAGYIWYQGEANAPYAYQYRNLLQAMIKTYRRLWCDEKILFLIVQLPPYDNKGQRPGVSDMAYWAEIRESQMMAESLSRVSTIVTLDGKDPDLHPKDKLHIGERLALAARALQNGEKLVFQGPRYKRMEIDGNKITLRFSSTDSGLVCRGDKLEGFTIAGRDRKFVEAEAVIEGERIVVCNPQVKDPAAVRYAWKDNTIGCNLYNGAGLPAPPFRTDGWELNSQDRPAAR